METFMDAITKLENITIKLEGTTAIIGLIHQAALSTQNIMDSEDIANAELNLWEQQLDIIKEMSESIKKLLNYRDKRENDKN